MVARRSPFSTHMSRSLVVACSAALAALALPAQAVVTETDAGPVSTLLDDFNGGPSIFSGQSLDEHANGSDGYIRALGPLSFTFNAETALSSLTLSFSYTACAYNTATGSCPTSTFPSAATVSLVGPGSANLLSTGLVGAAGTNPGQTGGSSVGTQFVSSFSNLLAGDYTLRFSPVGGSVIFKLDDVALTAVSAVPEPASVALMLAGLGVVGLAARRRRR